MNRKDTLRALLGSSTSAPEKEEAPASDIRPVPEQPQSRVGAGAVRAMGLSLQKLTAEADRGRVLQAQLEGGSNVVEIDPDCIDPSFISDRLSPADDDSFRELVESIATHGQQVPILVRPHPNQPGRYQIAYGHRRVRAASTLKKKVRAIIRALTNAELVIAQGKENLERRDLSFIERALFAKALEDEGFERATVIAALTVHKAEMTRFIAVARSIPFNIIQAIGPAPKAGRPRWMLLARRLEEKHAARMLERLFLDPSFRSADSDTRFVRVLEALAAPSAKTNEFSSWRNTRGQPIVKIDRSAAITRLVVDEKLAPEFGAFLIEKLPGLYDEFSKEQKATS
jgi:ParB family transcriptional regulator, chromosome partitioning protein